MQGPLGSSSHCPAPPPGVPSPSCALSKLALQNASQASPPGAASPTSNAPVALSTVSNKEFSIEFHSFLNYSI